MKSKKLIGALRGVLKALFAFAFWLLVWQIAADSINKDAAIQNFLFPDIESTFKALSVLLLSDKFYEAVLFSIMRVLTGLALGITLGILLGVICKKIPLINTLASPFITVLRSTPVASFIVMLWVLLSGDQLSVFIAFLMVMPIIWQSTCDGFAGVDNELSELADLYQFSFGKRFKLLIFPTLKKYLIPAVISSTGLAWKAEIAAEIIGYTKKSIGQGINDAKQLLDTPTVFAWTVVIIFFSIILEKGTKYLLGRLKK